MGEVEGRDYRALAISLRRTLDAAPIIGTGEPSAAFRARQDKWLNEAFRDELLIDVRSGNGTA